ncbi:hypothetical protein EIN_170580 [Entamoeba invadens IP1]|uniref:Uncharacterized protein n=1 Tax=Entamoeba invadens IP1 TaxID=370355 RepID=A0A0A1U0W6_ENTIV|nr:hypothetical protein EIN_170580 [Entamoeba invadens IP1]ELP84533.1 hypothetical protein EIN_170580 [Entamoeba invadens IP1]|eukprot:XP_004183879.1 hypothetical protein EIN_170580 [Entamoeba invadens IP1]
MSVRCCVVLDQLEMSYISIYCPLPVVSRFLFVSKKCKLSVELAPMNPERTSPLCKGELKMYTQTELLQGRMTDIVHTLSVKKWAKRTLKYAKFAITFNNSHDYSKVKFYHDIAKDVKCLTLSLTKIDDLLMILKESPSLETLRLPYSVLIKIHETYPLDHLLSVFHLKYLMLEKTTYTSFIPHVLMKVLENYPTLNVFFFIQNLESKVADLVSTHNNVFVVSEDQKNINFFVKYPKRMYFTGEFVLDNKKVPNYEKWAELYLPRYVGSVAMDITSFTLRGEYRPEIEKMYSLKYLVIDERKKKTKTVNFKSMNLVGLTLLGSPVKRSVELPSCIKELKIDSFCDVDSFITPLGTNGIRMYTSLTKLQITKMKGTINPPHSLSVLVCEDCTVGKIDTKDFKGLYSLKFVNVKCEGLQIAEKIEEIHLEKCEGIRSDIYKNDCFMFYAKEE